METHIPKINYDRAYDVETIIGQIGSKVKRIRKKKKVTRDDLAIACGCSERALESLEKGGRMYLNFPVLIYIAAALDVDFMQFFCFTDEERSKWK